MEIRSVLLDLDGTLFDRVATLRQFAFQQHHRFIQPRALNAAQPIEDWCEAFLALHERKLTGIEVYRRLGRRFGLSLILQEALLQDWECGFHLVAKGFVGTLALMHRLHGAGLDLVLLSNGTAHRQRARVRALGIDRWLDGFITSDQLGVKKPDPRLFQAALDCVAGEADRAVMVGDDLKADIRGARALGIHTIHKAARSPSGEADFASDSLFEITDFILRHAAPIPSRQAFSAA